MRLALRRLRHSPGFTAAALLTLALGIGANALIFSVVNAVFLWPLSYRDAGRLVWVTEFYPRFNRSHVLAPDYEVWRRESSAFVRLEAMSFTFGSNLTSPGRPAERIQTAHVTPGFFSMIGIQPRLGAGFDATANHADAAIVSDALWRGYLGAGDPSALAAPIRRIAQAIDPSQPVFDVELLEHRVSASLAERRQRAAVLGAFAALALLIAIMGIYGVISYSVARRTHEIGLRMALGAGRGDVLRLVVGGGLRLAACGMALGLAGAFAVTRVLKSFLYGVAPTDRITFGAVCAILAAAAFLASYLPARRAAAVDPMAALRRE